MHSIIADAIFVHSGNGGDFVQTLLFLVVVAIIFGIILWIVSIAPFIPPTFKQVINWIIYLFAALVLINVLLGMVGHSPGAIHW